MRELLELFSVFARIGLFTFGGGYAMIPLIENACVGKRGWITEEEMTRLVVLAESTPGPVAINCATYVGLKKKGFAGAVAATIGVVLPSFVILLLISFFLDSFLEIKWVASAFRGIKIAVGILILDAAVRLIRKTEKKPFPIAVLSVSFAAMLAIDVFALRISTVVLMLAAALAGLLADRIRRRAERGSPE